MVPLERVPSDPILVRYPPDATTDVLVAKAIPRLIEAGFEDRILLSHNVCFKTFLTAYGGTGYSYLLGKFMPYLQTQGVTEEQADKSSCRTPRRCSP